MAKPGNAEVVQQVTSLTSDILEEFSKHIVSTDAVKNIHDNDKQVHRIREHLKACYQFADHRIIGIKNPVNIIFDSSCEWINVNEPNLPKESASKIIIFEFFTHCCINCIHSINELRQILKELQEERKQRLSQDGNNGLCDIKLMSIHSPKFSREQDSNSVRAFVEKMFMEHSDVVNDPNRTVWSNLEIFCWPTILVFGPNPISFGSKQTSAQLNLIFSCIGEGHGRDLKLILETSTKYFDEVCDFSNSFQQTRLTNIKELSLAKRQVESTHTTNTLYYPGKVCARGQRLAIADSGNNRLLITTTEGILQEIIGTCTQGFADGDFLTAQFSNPQGIVFENDYVFYVADTGNHAVRRIDLDKREVTTLVPPKATTLLDDETLSLKSPWDLAFYGPELLLVAAAGNHQIFGYFFQPLELFRIRHEANTFGIIAGSGKEENRNNSYILKSSFAQPSGVSVSSGGTTNQKFVFVADSESSSIRMIDGNGKVVGLVGGSRDPTDLFAYGDQDGISYEVKLQHPVGVSSNCTGSKVFIADTFNHKIKVIEVDTKRCTTLIGNGSAGDRPGSFTSLVPKKRHPSSSGRKSPESPIALLNEPGGLFVDAEEEFLYIADTNNHVIKIANIKEQTVSSLELKWDTVDSSIPKVTSNISINPSNEDTLKNFNQEFDVHFNANKFKGIELWIRNLTASCEGGEWEIISSSGITYYSSSTQSGKLSRETPQSDAMVLIHDLGLTSEKEGGAFTVKINLFFCDKNSCYMRRLNFLLRLDHLNVNEFENDSDVSIVTLSHTYAS